MLKRRSGACVKCAINLTLSCGVSLIFIPSVALCCSVDMKKIVSFSLFIFLQVERVVGMVEGAVLVVDAGEGPLAQTKFVLAKALKYGLRPILLLNKVDKPAGITFLRLFSSQVLLIVYINSSIIHMQ